MGFVFENSGAGQIISKTNKQYINFQTSFDKQSYKLKEFWDAVDYAQVKKKFSKSSSILLELNPDVFSMELTTEGSVFYVFRKIDYSFFIQHFLDVHDIDDDEMIITMYRSNIKLPSYAGTLNSALAQIKNVLFNGALIKLESSVLHEFSN